MIKSFLSRKKNAGQHEQLNSPMTVEEAARINVNQAASKVVMEAMTKQELVEPPSQVEVTNNVVVEVMEAVDQETLNVDEVTQNALMLVKMVVAAKVANQMQEKAAIAQTVNSMDQLQAKLNQLKTNPIDKETLKMAVASVENIEAVTNAVEARKNVATLAIAAGETGVSLRFNSLMKECGEHMSSPGYIWWRNSNKYMQETKNKTEKAAANALIKYHEDEADTFNTDMEKAMAEIIGKSVDNNAILIEVQRLLYSKYRIMMENAKVAEVKLLNDWLDGQKGGRNRKKGKKSRKSRKGRKGKKSRKNKRRTKRR